MGRQTAVVATEQDERTMLAFLRSSADIRILRVGARTRDEVWVTEFAPYDRFHDRYLLWNTAFAWEPDIQQAEGRFIVRDRLTACPVIDFVRTDVERLLRPDNTLLVAFGRLYWAKPHVTDCVAYNVAEFDRWYDRVIRWVRKQGRRVPAISLSPYLLPDAWRRWQEREPV